VLRDSAATAAAMPGAPRPHTLHVPCTPSAVGSVALYPQAALTPAARHSTNSGIEEGEFQARVLNGLGDLTHKLQQIERMLKVNTLGSPHKDSLVQFPTSTRGGASHPNTPSHAQHGLPHFHGNSTPQSHAYFSAESGASRPRPSYTGESESADAVPPGLPEQWPSCLLIRDGYDVEKRSSDLLTTAASQNRNRGSSRIEAYGDVSSTTTTGVRRAAGLDPHGRIRNVVDTLCLLAIMYDMILLPLSFAWDLGISSLRESLRLATDIFWMCEVLINFCTGFHTNGGELERRVSRTAWHYLTHWFVVDLSLTVCGVAAWCTGPLVFRGGAAVSSSVKQVGATLRFMTLLRVHRTVQFYEALFDRCSGDTARLWLTFSAMCCIVMWLTHVAACAWYAIGSGAQSDTGGRWITENTLNGVGLDSFPVFYQYWTSYHWTIAQMTLGGSDISPVSTNERLYNVACLLAGFFISSTLVSSLSSTMIEFRISRKEQKQMLRVLRRFLKQREVDATISLQVQRQVVLRLRDRARLTLDEVPALQMLSSSMRSKLNYVLVEPVLCKHGLFNIWATTAPELLRKMVDKAVTPRFLMIEDDLFIPSVIAEFAYAMLQGEVCYVQDIETAPVETQVVRTVVNGQWLSEMALWVKWIHVGTAQAITQCDLVSISPTEVAHVLGKDNLAVALTREYGRLYHQRVIAAKPPESEWPNDLVVPYADVGDLYPLMYSQLQAALGKHFLDLWQSRHRWRVAKLDTLREEVANGTSTIFMTIDGDLERVVSVTALRIESPQGDILTQLGKFKDGVAEADCKMPGGKQQRGETPADAAKRVLGGKLSPVSKHVQLIHQQREVKWSQSASYDMRTKYLRTTCFASFRDLDCSEPVKRPSQGPLGEPRVSKSNTALNAAEGEQLLQMLSEKCVFEHESTLYVWLAPETLDTLLFSDNEWVLETWLSRPFTVLPLEDARMVLGGSPADNSEKGTPSRNLNDRSFPLDSPGLVRPILPISTDDGFPSGIMFQSDPGDEADVAVPEMLKRDASPSGERAMGTSSSALSFAIIHHSSLAKQKETSYYEEVL